jgi:hypothetical protein
MGVARWGVGARSFPAGQKQHWRGAPMLGLTHTALLPRLGADSLFELYNVVGRVGDLNERRRAAAAASRDMRYFAERLRTAQGEGAHCRSGGMKPRKPDLYDSLETATVQPVTS